MVDILNKKLSIGDKVAFILINHLEIGYITKFYKDKDFGYLEECSVDNHPHIKQFRIIKIENGDDK